MIEEQFELDGSDEAVKAEDVAALSAVALEESEDAYTVSGEGFNVVVDKATGAMTSYVYQDKELLDAPLEPNFVRPLNENDRASDMFNFSEAWAEAEKGRTVEAITTEKLVDGMARINVTGTLGNGVPYAIGYVVYGNGDVTVENQLMPNDTFDLIPLIGTTMKVPANLNNVT